MHRSAWPLALTLVLALSGCGGADAPAARTDGDTMSVVDRAPGPEPAGPAATPAVTQAPVDGELTAVPAGEMPVPAASAGPTPAPTPSADAPGPGPSAPSSPPASPVPGSTDANDILDRAEQTYAALQSMSADFVQRVYVPLLETTQNSRGTMFHRAPDRFLMRFSDPAGDLVLADGRYIWMFYPSTDDKQVMRAALSPGGQQVDLHKEFLSDATSRFNATRTGGETVGARQTHALTLTPRGPSPYRQVRLWIDAENSLVRRFEITEENGSVRTIELSNIRLNPSLGADLFVFEVPAGVQVHDF